MGTSDLPTLQFFAAHEFADWLAAHGASSLGAWLKFAKKASGLVSISRAEAVDAALCFGWIDGRLEPCDATHWLVRFSPRGAASRWSQKNRLRAEELMAAGRVRASGIAEIERAKADGRWRAAYPAQSWAEVPDDFSAALARDARAQAFFATLGAHNRYAILYRLHQTKTAGARKEKIEKFIAMLERGETFHPQKRSRNP